MECLENGKRRREVWHARATFRRVESFLEGAEDWSRIVESARHREGPANPGLPVSQTVPPVVLHVASLRRRLPGGGGGVTVVAKVETLDSAYGSNGVKTNTPAPGNCRPSN